MITPTKLHYVRNHGNVPLLHWETHTLLVYADPSVPVDLKLREYTMEELTGAKFEDSIIEIPITLGCDGNRRGEVNRVKRTKGFDWTASGVSTAIWRGVPVAEVLRDWGFTGIPAGERWYLNFEGAETLQEGKYATSIPLEYALDYKNDVMLAFGMNGRVLHPDHGYGYVGGRQIKWLKKVWITTKPNDSYYHLYDNKVIPSYIESTSDPLAQTLFKDESTACWEQTLQSIICEPAHEEHLELTDETRNGTYTIKGLAFNGGGERIERVELSLDGGKTWRYCFRHFVESPLRHAEKYWAWIFWSCEIPVKEIIDGSEFIIVRAHDQKKNFQPEHITCNSWYRVRRSFVEDLKTTNSVLRFQHPVALGGTPGGWMEPNKAQAKVPQPSQSLPTFDLEEVQKHDKEDDAWMILDNKVYDLSGSHGPSYKPMLAQHPGGATILLRYAGKASIDATIEYDAIHDKREECTDRIFAADQLQLIVSTTGAHTMRDTCLIGRLSDKGVTIMRQDAERAAKDRLRQKEQQRGFAFQPDVFVRAILKERLELTSSVRRYTFEIPRGVGKTPPKLGLPVGRHVQLAVHFEDQAVLRSYTPTFPVLPSEDVDGTFQLLVKTYFPDKEIASPGGTVSNYLDCLQIGEEIDVRGPVGEITYNPNDCAFEIGGQKRHFDKINLLAGGTGVTPIWQLIHAILSSTTGSPALSLINCNVSEDDILLREKLEGYASSHSARFKIWNVLSSPNEAKQRTLDPKDYSAGRVALDIMQQHFDAPQPTGTVATFICGPVGLVEQTALPTLTKWGFEEGYDLFIF
uniref:Nitrate reductase [NADPH] n=1 Tax=Ganoderma lucidum TaxID=5315 RepID=A0A2H4WRE4_GANLU|nr:nitrate reductase [Ganoderma lucidum]